MRFMAMAFQEIPLSRPSEPITQIEHCDVLIVEDDPAILRLMEHLLTGAGVPIDSVGTGEECLEFVSRRQPSAVLLDLGLPDMPGQAVLERLRQQKPDLPIVVVTASEDVQVAVDCMRLGASDFVQKPFEQTRLIASVRNAHERGQMKRRLQRYEGAAGAKAILGESPAIRRTLGVLDKAVGTKVTILITGASGTGKELFARAVHTDSERAAGPFVTINCAAIPESLIESELFGHVRGAFSGANRDRIGLFQQACGGTIFLDEIGELPLEVQARLLRVLQERVVRPVGGGEERSVDVRVVAATNRVLEHEVAAGRFREDLFYRLSVFPIEIPELHDRGDDLLLLASHFVQRFRERSTREEGPPEGFTEDATKALRAHTWPGNVRELENAIERAMILEDGPEIGLSSLPDDVVCAAFETKPESADVRAAETFGRRVSDRQIRTMEEEERRIFLHALELCGWKVGDAAEALGIGRATLYRRIRAYGLEPTDVELGGS